MGGGKAEGEGAVRTHPHVSPRLQSLYVLANLFEQAARLLQQCVHTLAHARGVPAGAQVADLAAQAPVVVHELVQAALDGLLQLRELRVVRVEAAGAAGSSTRCVPSSPSSCSSPASLERGELVERHGG